MPAAISRVPSAGRLGCSRKPAALRQHRCLGTPKLRFNSPHGNRISVDSRASAMSASSGAGGDEKPSSGRSFEEQAAELSLSLTNYMPVWLVASAAAAIIHPPLFNWFGPQWMTYLLGLTMLGMGFTLTFEDFMKVVRKMPFLLFLGMILQYTVLPLLGYTITKVMGLPAALATGVILVSCCPGGTASNIVAYIARGEMGLSILMTTASTLAAVIATPTLSTLLIGTLVPVSAKALFLSTLQVVLAPVLGGAFINQCFPKTTARIARFCPLAATILVCLMLGNIFAHNVIAIKSSGPILCLSVFCLHLGGFTAGYLVSRWLGLSEKICRTNSIEVGMQNSALGVVLATLHFSDPLVAAPCAVSACTHTVMGSILASYWRRQDDLQPKVA